MQDAVAKDSDIRDAVYAERARIVAVIRKSAGFCLQHYTNARAGRVLEQMADTIESGRDE